MILTQVRNGVLKSHLADIPVDFDNQYIAFSNWIVKFVILTRW